jgi:hypothetical protein
MNFRLLILSLSSITVLCNVATKPVDVTQISSVKFNGFSKFRTITTYSDTNAVDTTILFQNVVSDSFNLNNEEIITIRDSVVGFSSSLCKYLQNKEGLFLLESIPGNSPVLSKRRFNKISYDHFPAIIYGLRQNIDSNYYFKNNANELISGSQVFLGNRNVFVSNQTYSCSVISKSISPSSTAYTHTIYYSNIGLIKKEEIDTILEMTGDFSLTGKKIVATYITELQESR